MRPLAILSFAAAALATGAIGAWSLGLASPRTIAVDLASYAAACSPAAVVAPPVTLRPTLVASHRYRAETCSGDYVCGEDGAWEVAPMPAALPAIRQ